MKTIVYFCKGYTCMEGYTIFGRPYQALEKYVQCLTEIHFEAWS